MPCELVEELALGVGALILILYDADEVELVPVNFVFVLFRLLLPLLVVLRVEEVDEELVFVVDDTECCFWI